ncbi:IclR family transcriptional regulator [Microvirga puerhi]|uniref:IclR family transcriptional regulator n=1 Tax=Microvirga puerhi TaxID=2876078 RepID=A0ABS7VTW1_9HYPH|nr:IclR family transcriptional regulator [Microvirga puerhi]MBZ6079024.1 IclR family transcriptional regulator [Microvirga puerhi]
MNDPAGGARDIAPPDEHNGDLMELTAEMQQEGTAPAPPKAMNMVGKSAQLLDLLAEGVSRFSQLSRITGHSNGTLHRLLKNLSDAGFVSQDPLTKDYFLSADLLRLAAKMESQFSRHVIVASDEMYALRDIIGETVCLCRRMGTRKAIVEEIVSLHGIKFEYGRGYSSRFHSGATGAALMSHMPVDDLRYVLERVPLEMETSKTVMNPAQILARVQEVTQIGYAISFGEVTPGTASISVPIQDGTGLYALTVVGPATRFYPLGAAEQVMAASRRIEARLR